MTSHTDARYRYLRGLWQRAASSNIATYKEREWLHLCRALCRISICSTPLPNRHAVRQTIKGCGDGIEEIPRELDDRGSGSPAAPPQKHRCRCCPPCRAARRNGAEGLSNPPVKDADVIGLEALIDAAHEVCEQPFVASSAHARAAREGAKPPRCAAYQQLVSMCGTGLQLVQEVRRKKLCESGIAYRLTAEGRSKAMQLRASGEAAEAAPLHPAWPPPTAGEHGVVLLLVDEHEGGGARHHLRTLCEALERGGARYETRALRRGFGDYSFVVADAPPSVTRVVPRPHRAQVSGRRCRALKDGRWVAQQAAMQRTSESDFGGRATIEYIIEGSIDAAVHTCARCAHLPAPSRRAVAVRLQASAVEGIRHARRWRRRSRRWIRGVA